MRRMLGTLAATGLLLAGCGDDSDAGEDTTTTETTEEDATTTTTEKVASVQQYASIVATHASEISAAIASARECTGLYLYPCPVSASLSVFTAGLKSETLALELDAADDDRPENGLYIGAVPDELERLTASTIEAAEAAGEAAQRFQDEGCGAQPGAEVTPAETCTETAVLTDFAFGDLEDLLQGWGPYL